MHLQLYQQLLSIIQSYDYNDQSGFMHLYKYARNAGVTGLTQREFVEHAKVMGVVSGVRRVDNIPVRSLSYDARNDKYRAKIMPLIDICPNCKGLGTIKIKLGQ